jgi:hypothetical protein
MSTVGEAYSLGRLNKARKSHSVPFKRCLRWQYSNVNGLEEIATGDQKIENTRYNRDNRARILLLKQVVLATISVSN